MMGPVWGGLGVGGVAAADQQVVVAELLGRLGERIARGQRVGAAEGAVGEQRGFVAAHGQRLLEHVVRLRGAHADGNYAAAVLLLEPERRLHSVGVKGVHYALYSLSLEVAGLGIELHIVRIRDLLYKNYDLHLISLSIQLISEPARCRR